jgi:flavin-dependent dehydrogenase
MNCDVAIVGAGPTGCALGSYLARRGARVTLIEAVERPESVVGESMLPGSSPIFEELDLDLRGFILKRGAVFCHDTSSVRFDFSEAESAHYAHAWQVQREVFDLRWRDVATREGCKILYAAAQSADIPAGVLQTSAGLVCADRIVDAGGRSMWLSRKLGLRVSDERLKNSAVGTRFRGVSQRPPDEPGDITICGIEGGWIWFIPFGGGLASVGVVMTPASPLRGTAEARFHAAIASSPEASARLLDARRVLPFRALQDFTATSTTFYGDHFALCGDAATFIDPVFSSGVFLGLHGARGLAAALDGGDLEAWQHTYRDGAGVFRKVIDHWYSGDFMTVALAPRAFQKPYYRCGIVSLLAGDVFTKTRRSPHDMADRMGELAAALRSSFRPQTERA